MTQNLPDDFPTVDTAKARDVDGELTHYSPEVLEEWPCRRCGAPTPVHQGGLDALYSFTSLLARMGQAPLKPQECLFCDTCTAGWRAARAEKGLDNDRRMRRYCAMLRDPGTPAHLLGEAEQFVAKVANEGKDVVRHYAELRKKAGKSRGGI